MRDTAEPEHSARDPGAKPQASLSRRSLHGGLWGVAETASSHALRVVSNLIMTRLLVPEAFGLMAMVITLHVALTMLTDIGIHRSIVRAPDGADPRFLRVAWVVQVLRGAAIAVAVAAAGAALWMLAPVLAAPGTVYADPDLPGLVTASALVVLAGSLFSTNQFLAERQMQFGTLTTLNIASQILSAAVTIGLALLEPTVWALLWGMLFSAVLRTILSHVVFAGPRMGLEWDRRIAREIWDLGKWLLGSSSFTFLGANADRFLLAALLDAKSFGFYIIAIMWVQGFSQLAGSLTGKIGFSALSEVHRLRPADLARVFRRLARINDALCIAGFVLFLFGGGFMITLLYPAEYVRAASFMPFLSLAILHQRFGLFSALLLSEGDGKGMLMASAATAITICVALPAGVRLLGIEGALLATALSPLAGAAVMVWRAAPTLGPSVRTDALWLMAICAGAVCVYLAVAPIAAPQF